MPARLFLLASCSLPLLAAPARSVESLDDVKRALDYIHEKLQAQTDCLRSVKSAATAEAAFVNYQKLTQQLAASHQLVSEEKLLANLARFPEEKQAIMEALQALAIQIARLKKADFCDHEGLKTLLLPPAPAPKEASPASAV